MATRALVTSEYPTLYRVHEVYARLILVLDSRRSERNASMSAKPKDYLRKLPEGVNLAAILNPHQKTGPLIHQQMLTSRMDKTKLTEHTSIYSRLTRSSTTLFLESDQITLCPQHQGNLKAR